MLKKKIVTLPNLYFFLFFSIEMINALRQMEDEYVVAENLLGARYR